MSLLVIGSVAFDDIETPFGRAEKIVGGAGTYIAWAASYFVHNISVVSIVGEDLPQSELDALESQADTTKEAILDSLSRGGFFPMQRSDLSRLVGSMDSIANLSSGAADRIGMRRFTLPAELNDLLVALAKVDVEAVETLRDAVVAMGSDLKEALQRAGAVDKIESKADEVYAELYRRLYDLDTDYKTFHQFKAIIERLECIADRCSSNAELLRHMALEYLDNN
jgi:predicted phosphate transport protein (TIGR00153 family)